jgi:hypothetical protein
MVRGADFRTTRMRQFRFWERASLRAVWAGEGQGSRVSRLEAIAEAIERRAGG